MSVKIIPGEDLTVTIQNTDISKDLISFDSSGVATFPQGARIAKGTEPDHAARIDQVIKKKIPTKCGVAMHNLWIFLFEGRLYTSSASSARHDSRGTGRGGDNQFTLLGMEGILPVAFPTSDPIVDFGGNGHAVVWALDSAGRLYTWGGNWYGVCGLGHTTEVRLPTLCMTDVMQVYDTHNKGAGPDRSSMWVRKTDNTVWCWGENEDGELGLGNTTGTISTPTRNPFCDDARIIHSMCGYAGCTFIQKNDNTIHFTGWNGSGHSGQGNTTGTSGNWVDVTTAWLGNIGNRSRRIKKIVVNPTYHTGSRYANNWSTLMIFEDGIISSCGDNAWGQLGNGTTTLSSTPSMILSGFSELYSYSIGSVFAVKSNGDMWAWGYNNQGQLGNGTTANVSTPMLVSTSVERFFSDEFNGSVQGYIQCTYILRNEPGGDRKLYVCGGADYYKSGTGYETPAVLTEFTRVLIPSDEEVVEVVSTESQWNGRAHIAICKSGRWFAWGYNGDYLITYPNHGNPAVPIEVIPGTLGLVV